MPPSVGVRLVTREEVSRESAAALPGLGPAGQIITPLSCVIPSAPAGSYVGHSINTAEPAVTSNSRRTCFADQGAMAVQWGARSLAVDRDCAVEGEAVGLGAGQRDIVDNGLLMVRVPVRQPDM